MFLYEILYDFKRPVTGLTDVCVKQSRRRVNFVEYQK